MYFICLYLYASCKVKISVQEREITSVHIYRGKSEVPWGIQTHIPLWSLSPPTSPFVLGFYLAMHTTPFMWRPWLWRTTTLCTRQSFPKLSYLQLRGNCMYPEQLPKWSLEHKPKQWFKPPMLANIFWHLQRQGPQTEGKCHTEKNKKEAR